MTNRVNFGNLDGSSYGLKVSKPGIDVFSAAPGDLLFDSTSAGLLRVRGSYIVDLTPGTDISATITHNLGVIPIILWNGTASTTGYTTISSNLVIRSDSSKVFIIKPGSYNASIRVSFHLLTQVV